MSEVSFDSPYYPYEKVQKGYNTFRGAEYIPLKIVTYLLDTADANGYTPLDDNDRARVRLIKYLYYDGAKPLNQPLPTDEQKRSLLFNAEQPELNSDEMKRLHPQGYRLFAQPYWLPAELDAKTILKCYIGKISPYSPYTASIGLTFELMANYGQETNTRSLAYSRLFAMECAIIEALNGVNITGVGTVEYNRATHIDAGSRFYHDEGNHVYRVLNMSLQWMESTDTVPGVILDFY